MPSPWFKFPATVFLDRSLRVAAVELADEPARRALDEPDELGRLGDRPGQHAVGNEAVAVGLTAIEGVAPGIPAGVASIASDQRDLGNMLRHFMTEAYIADAMPGVDGNRTNPF